MKGRFQAYEVALELAAALAPVLASLARRDSSLASQLRRAAASVPLCLAEGPVATVRTDCISTGWPPAAPPKYGRPWPWREPGPSWHPPSWRHRRPCWTVSSPCSGGSHIPPCRRMEATRTGLTTLTHP
jgi:hypothetical protein